MKCPACDSALGPISLGAVTVDACQGGCGGVWFDRFELPKLDELSESSGQRLLEIERKAGIQIDPSKRLRCPKCNTIMMRHYFSVKRQALVDECPQCAGMWFDAGELATIRKEFPTEAERKRATEEYFNNILGKELPETRSKGERGAESARKIAPLFRFIFPR